MTAIDYSKPRQHFFDVPHPQGAKGTHRVAFFEWGNPAAPPVICVHGLSRNAHDFDFLAAALCDSYRFICMDMPGRGDSEYFTNLRWYENGTYMHDVLAITERLNLPQFDWIGTSMGGLIGMMIAALMPGKITRMVINDIGALVPKEGLMRIGNCVGARHHFRTMDDADQYLRKILEPFGVKHSTHWEHILRHSFKRQADGTVGFNYDPNIGEAFRLAASQMEKLEDISLWMLWQSITIPCLILRGELSDILQHPVAQKMCEMNRQATLKEFPGIGHAPSLMEDDQIQTVREWLVANPLPNA